MKGILNPDGRYGDDKIIDACSLFGMMDTSGRRFSIQSRADVTGVPSSILSGSGKVYCGTLASS